MADADDSTVAREPGDALPWALGKGSERCGEKEGEGLSSALGVDAKMLNRPCVHIVHLRISCRVHGAGGESAVDARSTRDRPDGDRPLNRPW